MRIAVRTGNLLSSLYSCLFLSFLISRRLLGSPSNGMELHLTTSDLFALQLVLGEGLRHLTKITNKLYNTPLPVDQ